MDDVKVPPLAKTEGFLYYCGHRAYTLWDMG